MNCSHAFCIYPCHQAGTMYLQPCWTTIHQQKWSNTSEMNTEYAHHKATLYYKWYNLKGSTTATTARSPITVPRTVGHQEAQYMGSHGNQSQRRQMRVLKTAKTKTSRPRNLSKVLKAMLSPNRQTKPLWRTWTRIMSQTKGHPTVTSQHTLLLKIHPTPALAGY